ncbi:MAG: FGGY-family carbohydrate kinase, partial [Candidatus Humimicrobiaceae bacterium]
QPSAFVAGKLAGITAKKSFIDPSFLSFSALSNLSTSEWSDELIEALNIDMDKLPKIVKATDIIGVTTKKTAELTGLAEGIPICAGCGDVTAGFIGAGIIKPGQMADISGTANILGISVSEFKYDRNVACMKSPVQNSYYFMSNVMGGRTLKWFAEEFFSQKKEELLKTGNDIYGYLDDKAKRIPPGSDGLVALIDLQGRFFPPDPSMRGLFVGHTWSHTRLHFYRSILEAVAYDHYFTRKIVKTLFPELDLNSVVAVGSGAKSKMWLQIKADVLQIPFYRLGRSDLSTLGAAIIAGLSVGIFKNIEEVSKKFLNIKEVIEPVKNADKKYAKYVETYIRSLDLMQEIFRKMFYQ